MVSMEKEEISEYLRNYTALMDKAYRNMNTPIADLFYELAIENNITGDIGKYFFRMCHVYQIHMFIRNFSTSVDYLLNKDDFVEESKIKGLEQYIDFKTEKPQDLTNKKIVKLIRNAFNHNGEDKQSKYYISKSAFYIEIDYDDINEPNSNKDKTPLKMKIGIENLGKIFDTLAAGIQAFFYIKYDIPEDFDINSTSISKELDKIKIERRYIKDKLSSDKIKSCKSCIHLEHLDEDKRIKKVEKLRNTVDSLSEHKTFILDELQKKKIANRIKKENEIFKDMPEQVLYHLLGTTIPVPLTKQLFLENSLAFSNIISACNNLTLQEIVIGIQKQIVIEGSKIAHEELTDISKDLYIDDPYINTIINSKSYTDKINLLRDIYDRDFTVLMPLIIYIEYEIMENYDEDERYIEIGNHTYDRYKLRNSFAHVRWYISDKKEIVMYDADPKNINDMNLTFIAKIDLRQFLSAVKDHHYEKKQNEIVKRLIK